MTRTQLPLAPQALTAVSLLLLGLAIAGCGESEPPTAATKEAAAPETAEVSSAPAVNFEEIGDPVEGYQRLDVRRTDNVLAARFVDRKLDANSSGLGDELLRLARDDQADKVVLDFSRVEFFGDEPFEQLMGMKVEADSQGKQMRLTGVEGKLREVFRIMHFDEVFELEPTLGDALQSSRSG